MHGAMISTFHLALILGVISAVFWGVSDLTARYSTKAIGAFRTLYLTQIVGLVILSPVVFHDDTFAVALKQPLAAWAWMVLAAVLFNASTLALYVAFGRGKLSVVSPISATYAVTSVALSLIAGEHVGLPALAGIATILIGLPFAASATHIDLPGGGLEEIALPVENDRLRDRLAPGAGLALLASLGYGVSFWIYGFLVTPKLGAAVPVWGENAVSSVILLPGFAFRAQPMQFRVKEVMLALSAAVCAVGGTYFDLVGLATGYVAEVSTLSSLYSTITVILAWIFLREKLVKRQWVGIVLILAGTLLVRG